MKIKFNKYICSDSKLEKAEIPATTPVDTIPAGTIPVATSIAEPPEVVATVFPVGGISVVFGENSPFPIHSKPQENEVEKWVRQDLAGSGIDLTDFREYGGKIIDTPEQFCELLGYVPNCTPYSRKDGRFRLSILSTENFSQGRMVCRFSVSDCDILPAGRQNI